MPIGSADAASVPMWRGQYGLNPGYVSLVLSDAKATKLKNVRILKKRCCGNQADCRPSTVPDTQNLHALPSAAVGRDDQRPVVHRQRARHRVHLAALQRVRAVHPRPGASTRAIADIARTRAHLPPQSMPKQKHADSSSSSNQPFYPISAAPQYPTAQQVQSFLSKSRITETELSVDNVVTLLNVFVLVLDGDIERVSLSPLMLLLCYFLTAC